MPESQLLHVKYFDKFVHFALFFILVLCLGWGLKKQHAAYSYIQIAWISLLAGTLYGALTEVFQHIALAEREGSVSDFVANTFGTVFGVVCLWPLYKHMTKKV